MKKLFLLLAGTSLVLAANAQERHSSIVFTGMQQAQHKAAKAPIAATDMSISHSAVAAHSANKTTSPTARWYFYDEWLANFNAAGNGTANQAPYMWNDTTSKDAYGNAAGGTEYDYNTFVSEGLSFNPLFTGFDDPTYYPDAVGLAPITATDAYTIDSVEIGGAYIRSTDPSKASVVDTLRIALVQGSTSLPTYYYTGETANYGVDTLYTVDMLHDSLHNRAADAAGIAAVHYYDILLTTADSGVNFATSWQLKNSAGTATPYSVTANNMVGCSVTFISGDASFTAGDTVFIGDATRTVKYGLFRPIIDFVGTSTTASFPSYNGKFDQNVGFSKFEPDANYFGFYVPHWAWIDASPTQYPEIGFHTICNSCTIITTAASTVVKNINDVKAFPNPTTGDLNIGYNLAKSANITVTLTNTLGQTVATQTVENTTIGRVTFSTTALPAGIYAYSVTSNGEHTTGSVSVVH